MRRVLQIFRDGVTTSHNLNQPLLDGEQGNMQTLNEMAKIVREDRTSPDLRTFVLREIVKTVPGHDFAGEVEKIFEFAQKRITYRQDPYNVERVADIWSTLYALNPNEPEGDCGIKGLFLASACAILGYKSYFVVIKQKANQAAFNHLYNAVVINGELKYFDPTPENVPSGWESPSMEKGLFSIFD